MKVLREYESGWEGRECDSKGRNTEGGLGISVDTGGTVAMVTS